MTARSSGTAGTAGSPGQPMTAAEWLAEVRGLDPEMTSRYGVKAGVSKTGEEVVAFPYLTAIDGEAAWFKIRTVGAKSFRSAPSGVPHGLYNFPALLDAGMNHRPVVITEGEIDCLSVIQSGFPRCVSLPDGWSGENGGAKAKPIQDAMPLLRRSPGVIIAGDMDQVGQSFVRAAANMLEGHPVWWVQWPEGCKDANDTLCKHGEAKVRECIENAKQIDPPGGLICGFSDAPPPPEGHVYTTGDETADRVFCLHTGFPTVVTGTPGAGKSTWLTWALAMVQRQHGVRVGMCMMETPWPILRDHLVRMKTGGRDWAQCPSIERAKITAELDENWRLLLRDESDDVPKGMAWVRDMLRTAAVRDGCRVVVFDPWNEIEHRLEPGESVTDYTNAALASVRKWSERYGVASVVVAHPTKMNMDPGAKPRAPLGYDISGSSAWFNKASIGLTVHRTEDEHGCEYTELINWKSKFEQIYPCRRGRVRMDFDPAVMVYRRRM
jgi:twinkle protein